MFRNEALHTIFVFFLLQDCIEAIAATAFVTSEYPVILSFENHCNQRNQEKMAKYCDSIFGDLLCRKEMKDFPVSSIGGDTLSVPLDSPLVIQTRTKSKQSSSLLG